MELKRVGCSPFLPNTESNSYIERDSQKAKDKERENERERVSKRERDSPIFTRIRMHVRRWEERGKEKFV